MKSTAPRTAAPYGQALQPTNAAKVGTLSRMLSAIKHIGRPEKSATKPPFAK